MAAHGGSERMTLVDGAGPAGHAVIGADTGVVEHDDAACERITLTGVVQGVGFRPFVARLAAALDVNGTVWNSSTAVFVEAAAQRATLDEFAERLVSDAPPLARITSVRREPMAAASAPVGFTIVASDTDAGPKSLVPPDAAVCNDCVAELRDPHDRRFGHPFITCTNCGPRFTIIRDLPYDRPSTTMASFEMCSACRAEYDDPSNRRHHAQPIGCHDCGPRLQWRTPDDADLGATVDDPGSRVGRAVDVLERGGTVAVKGLGGFQLVCRADDDTAVRTLRRRKARPDKPLAVMVPDLDAARRLARVGAVEARELASTAAPIVLLEALKDVSLSPLVAPDDPLVGVMLPSTPLQHLLFDAWRVVAGDVALVVTSANASGAPICHRDDELDDVVLPLADAVLTHDRPIHTPCDDSVVRIVDGTVVPIRRARGYAPMPFELVPDGTSAPGPRRAVLAVGGELKNTVAVVADGRAHVGQHVGDLENLATLAAFEQQVADLCRFHDVTPDVVVADLHPDYLGTRWARRLHPDRTRLVQHHHAHVAAVMAEHGLDPHRRVVGVAFDGTGYGTDGTIWGGEFLLASADGFERVGSLATFLLPGADAAVREPWRVALSLLRRAEIEWADDLAPVRHASDTERTLLAQQLERRLVCPPTSSMGRLFDGVASLLGVRHRVTFEAHAAIELEIAARRAAAPFPIAPFVLGSDGTIEHVDVVRSLVDAMRRGADVDELAAGFHHEVVELVAAVAERHASSTADGVIALSGGVFQNSLVTSGCRRRLTESGADVRSHRLVPPNDGGLSLGQAWIGLHGRSHESARKQG
ncbi:MAG: carbamoyltransferase HypF [Actinomycetota bacterium]